MKKVNNINMTNINFNNNKLDLYNICIKNKQELFRICQKQAKAKRIVIAFECSAESSLAVAGQCPLSLPERRSKGRLPAGWAAGMCLL